MFNRIDVGPGPPLGPSVSLKLYITVDIRVSQEINRSTEAARSPWWKDVLKTEPELSGSSTTYHCQCAKFLPGSTCLFRYLVSITYVRNAKDYYWSGIVGMSSFSNCPLPVPVRDVRHGLPWHL